MGLIDRHALAVWYLQSASPRWKQDGATAHLTFGVLRSIALSCAAATYLGCVAGHAQGVSPLSAYNVDPNTVSVAGVSSGAFMAVQLQVAYSARIFGTSVFAGGPYDCAEGNSIRAQEECESGTDIKLKSLIGYTDTQAAKGTIDPTGGLANKPIYMFSGVDDTTVHPRVMDVLQQYYLHYTGTNNITFNRNTVAGHAWISPDGPNSCDSSYTPYINNCGIDPEQTFLTLFFGILQTKNTGHLGGRYIQFDQNAFFTNGNAGSASMDGTGWVFVPSNCQAGQTCRLLIVLHGCLQNQAVIGQQFVHKSGIDEWADTNDIIVLYPQATSSLLLPFNPFGCWDWWGYTGPDYALKSGPQMTAIMAMVSRITGSQ